MQTNHIALKTGAWCGDKTIQLDFPNHWEIETHQGNEIPELDATQIGAQFENPVDGFKLQSLLGHGKKVAIVIDDHTRPTPAADILRTLLGLLKQSGILQRNIKILVAIGTHILENESLLRNKLNGILGTGVEIVVPDCRKGKDLVFLGTSNTGIPVYINKHFANADVRIAVSGIYPHDEAGFSGGAKILIGILGLKTLSRFHRKYGLLQRGAIISTAFRAELEHFADMAKLDYSINCIINNNGKIAELYCGDFRKAFRVAAAKAQTFLGTRIRHNADVIIANAYPLDNSLCVLGKSTWPFHYCKKGAYKIVVTALCDYPGDRIALASSEKEQIYHHLKRKIGLTGAKRTYKALIGRVGIMRDPARKWEKPFVIHIAHIDPRQKHRPKIINNCHIEYDWKKIIGELLDNMGHAYPARVSIYPYTPLHFPFLNDNHPCGFQI